ncbi:MAG: glycoside hydrolase family 127 protein [Bacteroidaceae bacterium]|nr:glycoside hydrolase family 127 protein [Bacteroidaceae bacterium]
MTMQKEVLFSLTDVRLTGGPLKAQQEQNRQYLLRLEPDRLLSRFRSEAGLEPKARPYGGWESEGTHDLAGHILAFYLSGASMMYEATGDEELKRRILYIANELETVQKANGCGYALAFKDGKKCFREMVRGNKVTDCYVLENFGGSIENGTVKIASYNVADSMLCYGLNDSNINVALHQTKDENTQPVQDSTHNIVQKVVSKRCYGKLQGDITGYTNENNVSAHKYVGGICQNCGQANPEYKEMVDGAYELTDGKDLNWFITLVNQGQTKANAQLTADIDYTKFIERFNRFDGTLDGHDHTLTLALKCNSGSDGALIGDLYGTVKNIVVAGSIDTNYKYAAGVVRDNRGGTIERVVVKVDFTLGLPGDNTAGGIVAVNQSGTIRQCVFAGSMTGPTAENCGGIVGWCNSGTISQCANIARWNIKMTRGSNAIARNGESNINVHPNPKTEYTSVINGHFEPIYTFNKVALGLYRAWVATGDELVGRVFLNLSDWFGTEFLDKLSDEDKDKILDCEHGSLPESFADAYRMTGDEKYLRWARRLCQNRMLIPLSKGDRRKLDFHHANNEIPKFTAAERVYRLTGEEWLHNAAVNAMEAFMCDYAFANGGNAYDEHLFPPNAFEEKFQRLAGPESGGSINMLRLTEALFETDPSARRMDFYERVLFNHILSTHDPFKGLTVYHTPTKWAASRTYSREFDAMWCCTGTGFEAPGKYAQMVFSQTADNSTVRVNLFAPATLDWKERGVRLHQETAFPYGETSCVKFDAVGKNAKFAVCIRCPSWADERFSVYVNGAKAGNCSNGYVTIVRKWKAGDRIDIEFPMALRAEPLPGSKKYAAFFYGPTLLVGNLGTEGLSRHDYIPPLSAGDGTPSFIWSNRFGADIPMATIPREALTRPEDYLEPTALSPLTFRMRGTEILMVPMFALHYSRYGMYWRLMSEDESRDYESVCAEDSKYGRRAVDYVVPGDRESEEVHRLDGKDHHEGEIIYGRTYGWRGTQRGGFFTYRLSVGEEDEPLVLVARYRVCETGPHQFDVQVDGRTIFTEELKDNGKRGFFYREMPIPKELTAGKKHVAVKFAAKPDNIAGGLFGLWLVH